MEKKERPSNWKVLSYILGSTWLQTMSLLSLSGSIVFQGIPFHDKSFITCDREAWTRGMRHQQSVDFLRSLYFVLVLVSIFHIVLVSVFILNDKTHKPHSLIYQLPLAILWISIWVCTCKLFSVLPCVFFHSPLIIIIFFFILRCIFLQYMKHWHPDSSFPTSELWSSTSSS